MKGFIEVIMENDVKSLVAISSIALVEQFPHNSCRITLKEQNESGTNITLVLKHPLATVQSMINKAQEPTF